MDAVIVPDTVREFVASLRTKYGTIDGVKIVPEDFLDGLADIVRRNNIVLEHDPFNRVALYKARAIKDYTDWLNEHIKTSIPPQPQSSYPFH